MSIENDLNRIANAVEKIAARFTDFAHSPTKPDLVAPLVAASTTPGLAVPVEEPASTPAPAAKRGRPAKDPAPAVETVAAITKDEVMELVRNFVAQKGSQTRAKEILAEYGAGRVAELDAKNYAEVVKKLKADMK